MVRAPFSMLLMTVTIYRDCLDVNPGLPDRRTGVPGRCHSGRMATLKTAAGDGDVAAFLDGIADPQRQADTRAVCALMAKAAKAPAVMWGPSIVGFGHRRLRYPDGREIDWMAVGVSPRKAATTLYLTGGLDEYADLLADLGKHTTGKGCLYVKKLDDVDLTVLTTIVARSVSLAKKA